MVIIRFQGGLGNQMFQYALYKWFENEKVVVKGDLHFYDDKSDMFQLEKIFGIKIDIATESEIVFYGDFSMDILSRMRRKFFGYKKSYCIEDINNFYDFKGMDDLYLSGYWQGENYFKSVASELSELFSNTNSLNRYQKSLLEQILKSNAASMHIRRGDYLTTENDRLYGGICTIEYYRSAVCYLKKYKGIDTIYIFTNDIEWVKMEFSSSNQLKYIVVDSNEVNDILLMAMCKHSIIANSSYSWWGAWLNNNPEKMIIAPSKWINAVDMPVIYCEDWIKIDSTGRID